MARDGGAACMQVGEAEGAPGQYLKGSAVAGAGEGIVHGLGVPLVAVAAGLLGDADAGVIGDVVACEEGRA
jgi:hypothetical protein